MAGHQYNYDESGYTLFFVLTFLGIILVPWTISAIANRQKSNARPPPTKAWNRKQRQVAKVKTKAPSVKKSHLAISVGWLVFAFVAWRVSFFRPDKILWDPFEILGIPSDSAEKSIRKHYKELSRKLHPDKVKLGENQTKEDAENAFNEITKAYKALTDEEIRSNYEKYGHPDGRQDVDLSIAIPTWVIEGHNNIYVLGLYGVIFGVLMPWYVGRWWYGSRARTKDGILTTTAATYYHKLKEDASFAQLIEILAQAHEFDSLLAKKSDSGKTKTAFEVLDAQVQKRMAAAGENLEADGFQKPAARRAAVLVYAHMFRIEIEDPALLKEKQQAVVLAHKLSAGLINVALAHNWLNPYMLTLSLQEFLIQALHPSNSPLLQLPHVTQELAERWRKEMGVTDLDGFVRMARELGTKEDTAGLAADQLQEAREVAENVPRLEIVSASFKVTGEKIVTPASWVHLVVRMRLRRPGDDAEEIKDSDREGAPEDEPEELLGKMPKRDEGAEPTPLAHAPYFPRDRKASWIIWVGDRKLDRVFISPTKFTDVGSSKIRTHRITFQGPPQAALYTLRLFIKSDSYVGSDAGADVKLHVQPPEALGADAGKEEDEISEPDEDTLAGQMAAMKGQPVKRKGAEDSDEDTSGTDDDDDDDDDSSSSSSSDSDSD